MIHVLLPAFNEGEALGVVIDGIYKTLGGGCLIWVVDDGSTDATAAVARGRAEKGVPVTLLQHGRNRGLGQAFRTGLGAVVPVMTADDVLVVLDADDTHPPALIPSMVRLIDEGGADLVIASRFAPGGSETGVPFFRRVLSAGARAVFTFLFPVPGVRDYTCAFRAYRGDLLRRGIERWGELVTEDGFASSAEWLLRLSVLKPLVAEVPLELRYDRKPTPSKMRVLSTIRRTLAMVSRFRKIR